VLDINEPQQDYHDTPQLATSEIVTTLQSQEQLGACNNSVWCVTSSFMRCSIERSRTGRGGVGISITVLFKRGIFGKKNGTLRGKEFAHDNMLVVELCDNLDPSADYENVQPRGSRCLFNGDKENLVLKEVHYQNKCLVAAVNRSSALNAA